MTDSVSWLVPNQVLKIILPAQPTVTSLNQVNDNVEEILNQQTEKICVYIDADQLKTTYQTSDTLRSLLPFTRHQYLDRVVTVSSNKLSRLILLMAFSTAEIPIVRFDDHEQAMAYLKRQ